ncbi:MAG TPA: DUF3857 and transglutaminase domain-containing protein [Thermoanaerobaculia bacterium]
MRFAALLVSLLAAAPAFAWGGAPDWLKQLATTQLPSYPADTAGVALLDEVITTVTPAGEIKTLHRRAHKVLSTSGRDLGYVAVYYDSSTKLTNFQAWAIAANGEEYRVKERDAVETSPFDGELYSDFKAKVLRIPSAEPGSIVAYEYEQIERPYGLQDLWSFQREVPVRRARYTLVLPAGWEYDARWFNAEAKQPAVTGNSYTWEVNDVAAIKEEPGMPDSRAVAARLAVRFHPPGGDARSHRSWNDIARWYNGLLTGRRAATPAIQAKARELTQGKATTYEKIAALGKFAQQDVRYVAIEIGIGGYQPHTANDVFTNRYGDCKDKVTVLASMLNEIGVESYYMLVHTERGVTDKEYPTLRSFNHAIIAVKLPADAPKDLFATVNHPKLGRLLVFDPTNDQIPVGLLPPYLQENRALLVHADGGDMIELAAHAPESSRLARTAKLTLGADGGVSGDVVETRTGASAAATRGALQTLRESERKQYIESGLAYSLTHYQITDLAFENLDDPSKSLVVRYKLAAPAYAKRAANMLLVRPRLLGRKAERIVDLKARKFGYTTDGPTLEVDEIDIVMPAGVVADELPPAAKVSTPVLSYTSESKFEGQTLRYRREYRVNRFAVPLEGIAELNKAYSAILADERSAAVFK